MTGSPRPSAGALKLTQLIPCSTLPPHFPCNGCLKPTYTPMGSTNHRQRSPKWYFPTTIGAAVFAFHCISITYPLVVLWMLCSAAWWCQRVNDALTLWCAYCPPVQLVLVKSMLPSREALCPLAIPMGLVHLRGK